MAFGIYEYLNLINTEHIRKPIFRVELLRYEDESIKGYYEDEIVNANGNLNVELSQGSRRSVSLTIKNIDGEHQQFFNNIFFGQKFRLLLGFEKTNGETFLIPQGIFVFDKINFDTNVSKSVVSFDGIDKWGMLNGVTGGYLDATYTIEKETSVMSIVSSLFALDIIDTSFVMNIENSIAMSVIPYKIEKDAGSTVADILEEVALTVNAAIYFDYNGVLIMEPFEYDFVKQSMHDFIYGDDINYISASKEINYSNIYNGVFIIGETYQASTSDSSSSTTIPIVARLVNNDPSDVNSAINLGYIKYKHITDYTAGITGSTYEIAEQKGLERCRYELKKAINKQSVVSITCSPMYHLDVNNAITLTDQRLGDKNKKYIIQSISIGIGSTGDMSISASEATTWL